MIEKQNLDTNQKHSSVINSNKMKQNDLPLITIIITSHNYGCYLSDAIESVLKQTYEKIEIIVIDAGSTDNTQKVANCYSVDYVFQKQQGMSVARNNGIKRSHGEFFVCLDGDDKLAPNYVEQTLRLMLKNPKIGFVRTGSVICNEILKIENILMPRRIISKYSLFAGWAGALGPALFRKKAYESLDYGFDPLFPAGEDLDICFRMLQKGWKSEVVFAPLYWYRIHQGSIYRYSYSFKKTTVAVMNKKFWFRELYRKMWFLHRKTLGRLESFMRYPIASLKAIKKKNDLRVWIKSLCLDNSINAEQLFQEYFLTVDQWVEWSRNRELRDYYERRLKILDSRLHAIFKADNFKGEPPHQQHV